MPTANFKVGEMMHQRTPNSKTWMNFDGSYTTEIHSGIVHFEDEHGNLQNVNTDLYDEADFDLIDEPVSKESKAAFKQAKEEAKAAKKMRLLNRDNYGFQGLKVPFDVKIPRNFKKGYTIGKGADRLTFQPVNASPSTGEPSSADRSVIVYQDVWNDTDVELKVQPDGLKETLYLKTDKAPTSFSFEVKGKDIAEDFTAGALKLMPAWLVDAAGTERDVEQVVVRGNDNKMYVELKADVTNLVYPIAIDPTVVIQPTTNGKDAYVRLGTTANYGNDVNLSVGRNSSGVEYITFIEFDVSTIKGVVTNAVLNLYQTSYWFNAGNSNIPFDLYRNTQSWSESTVGGLSQPPFDPAIISTVRSSANSDGWKNWDCTSVVQAWLAGANENFGFRLQKNSASNDLGVNFVSSESTNSNKPKLAITYNEPPTAPTVTAPNGGENWNAEHLTTWQASTDAESDVIVYEAQLSTDNGVNWHTVFTNASGTSYSSDFTNESETATALLRIRAYDGTSYSDWDMSDGVFTIQHNAAPDTPINLLPSGGQARDRAQPIRLSWLHNDPDAGDPQSQYDVQWRPKGLSTWTTVSQVSTNQFHDLTGLAHGEIEWRVRTYDQAGLSSPYSDIALFLAGDKPAAATIVSPANGATVAVANPTVQWSSAGQAAYRVTVKDSVGAVVWTDEKTSANKAVTVSANLENQTAYTVEVAIRNMDGLWSDAVQAAINVSYTPPAVPLLTISGNNQQASIQLTIANPVASGTEPAVSHHDLFRKAPTESLWKRIANALPANGSFTDRTPASGQQYEYYVRAWGDNGTYRDSAIVRESITLRSIWLMDPSEPESLHRFHYFEPGRSTERIMQGQLMEFEGRENPMAEFSSREQRKVNVVLQLKKESTDLEDLDDLIGRRTTLLYRDAKGRRIYGAVFVLSENETDFGYTVPLEVQQVGYEEEV